MRIHLFRKRRIGLALGLMILLVNQGATLTIPTPPPKAYPIPTVPAIKHLAFSHDSNKILFIIGHNLATLAHVNYVNINTGKAVGSTKLSTSGEILGFTPNGIHTTVLERNGLRFINNKTGKALDTFEVTSVPGPNEYEAKEVITNKSGSSQLFHSANKRLLSVINTKNGKNTSIIQLPNGRLRGMGISPNERLVSYVMETYTPDLEYQLHIYDTDLKKVTQSFILPTLKGSRDNIETITFSPKERYLLVRNNLVDLAPENIGKVTLGEYSIPTKFTSNGRFLLYPSGLNRKELLRYDLKTKQQQKVDLGLPDNCGLGQAVDMSQDERLIAYSGLCSKKSGYLDYLIIIVNAGDGSLVRKLELGSYKMPKT